MNKHKCFLGLAILATLVTTPAQAEPVSRKAANLMAQNSNSTNSVDQNTNNTQPVNTLASTYKGSDTDSKLPASNYWYVSGSVGSASPGNDVQGSSFFNDKISLALDSTSQWNIAGGYQRGNYRSEAEISYSSFGINNASINTQSFPYSGNVSTTSILGNIYWDIPTRSKFRPYLGAGLGTSTISGTIKYQGQEADLGTGWSFAYQGKVGLQYEVVEKGNAFVEFRYVGLTGYTSDKNNTRIEFGSFNSPALSFGYRQGF
ncbi:MAG: outer membrane protein [Dolichospermum sp.]